MPPTWRAVHSRQAEVSTFRPWTHVVINLERAANPLTRSVVVHAIFHSLDFFIIKYINIAPKTTWVECQNKCFRNSCWGRRRWLDQDFAQFPGVGLWRGRNGNWPIKFDAACTTLFVVAIFGQHFSTRIAGCCPRSPEKCWCHFDEAYPAVMLSQIDVRYAFFYVGEDLSDTVR